MPSPRSSRPRPAESSAEEATGGRGTGTAGCGGCLGVVVVGLLLLALLIGGFGRDAGDPAPAAGSASSSAGGGPAATASVDEPLPPAGTGASPSGPRAAASPTTTSPSPAPASPSDAQSPAGPAGGAAGEASEARTTTPAAAAVSPEREAAPSSSAPAVPTAPATAPARAGTALALLDTLEVKGRAPKTGYERERFGQSWADVDRNGCDTRNDILRRDLVDVVLKAGTGGCKVLRGTLHGPYTGTTIAFVSGPDTSADVQIDHVVALSDAWQKGAQSLSADERAAFANDPLNLLAVDGPTNQSKSDGDAATWLPPNKAYRCPFVARQVAVKAEYGLWVTAAERDAIARVLAACPDQEVPTRGRAGSLPGGGAAEPVVEAEPAAESTPQAPVEIEAPPAPEPAAPAPAEEPQAPAADVYYKNCDAARAAGAAPLLRGEPGYRPRMDGDDDGVACE
ncbi:DUF1524 domain-containing protein [Micrococcus flavus]|uniref:Excalibur calcium-binding domain-containing protein n=1 Tax=Micrococcus flavus TaxID=384602 RepID=A0A4Y8X2I3_9MICC|nr:DUF1524 domain-containing protein [Micrococcus flavus]MBB4883194.1 hypothetical protein [Micrococcus flavus]TFI03794.1 DUF1524 domain-containing protein [Micrococcus flavus]